MGIEYQAQVEVFVAATEHHREFWQPVSRWELQKDYAFFSVWLAVARRGWPPDVFDKYAYDVDSKLWGDGRLFASLESAASFTWFVEAREHVKRLLSQGYQVRVLTWAE